MNKVIVICGPTASGKTSLSIEVAKKFDAEIVSADSMQIYKEMNIGTAKPDDTERSGIIHHMMDIVSVTEDYNVSRYVKEASECIDDILSRGKNVVIVGGTGLYIDNLINNTNFFEFDNDEDYRRELTDFAAEHSGQALLERLRLIDPDSAERLHPNDVKRVIRALEVYKVTGKTLTQLHKESSRSHKYQPIFVALNYKNRDVLYDRINKRVDIMLQQGFVDEAKQLLKFNLSSTARAAIGYSDIFDYLSGKKDFDEAVENIKQKSRNYAKRQITWFKRNEEIFWIYPDAYQSTDDIYNDVFEHITMNMR